MLLASLRVANFKAWKKENMETNQKQHTKELKSLKLKMDDVKFANSKMTKELAKSEKANSNLEFEIKQLKKKLENHQKTKEKSPKECVENDQILLFLTSLVYWPIFCPLLFRQKLLAEAKLKAQSKASRQKIEIEIFGRLRI